LCGSSSALDTQAVKPIFDILKRLSFRQVRRLI
jgi:hypothetical protein